MGGVLGFGVWGFVVGRVWKNFGASWKKVLNQKVLCLGFWCLIGNVWEKKKKIFLWMD